MADRSQGPTEEGTLRDLFGAILLLMLQYDRRQMAILAPSRRGVFVFLIALAPRPTGPCMRSGFSFYKSVVDGLIDKQGWAPNAKPRSKGAFGRPPNHCANHGANNRLPAR